MNTERRTVMVRDLDWGLWVALRAEAIRRRCTTARLLEEILRVWFVGSNGEEGHVA